MLRFWVCFLSFFYTLNGFSTKKEEEKTKCCLCNNITIKIEKESQKIIQKIMMKQTIQ